MSVIEDNQYCVAFIKLLLRYVYLYYGFHLDISSHISNLITLLALCNYEFSDFLIDVFNVKTVEIGYPVFAYFFYG